MAEVLISYSHLIHEVQHTNMSLLVGLVVYTEWFQVLVVLFKKKKKHKTEAYTNRELATVSLNSRVNIENRYIAMREQQVPSNLALGYFAKLHSFCGQVKGGVGCQG